MTRCEISHPAGRPIRAARRGRPPSRRSGGADARRDHCVCRPLGEILYRMGECGLGNFAGCVRPFRGPVPDARPEAVRAMAAIRWRWRILGSVPCRSRGRPPQPVRRPRRWWSVLATARPTLPSWKEDFDGSDRTCGAGGPVSIQGLRGRWTRRRRYRVAPIWTPPSWQGFPPGRVRSSGHWPSPCRGRKRASGLTYPSAAAGVVSSEGP